MQMKKKLKKKKNAQCFKYAQQIDFPFLEFA